MVIESYVNRRRIEVRGLDSTHPGFLGHTGEMSRNVRPAAAVVGGEPHITIIGSRPENSWSDWRLGDGRNGSVGLRAGVVARYPAGEAGAHDDARRVLGGKVGGDRIEVIATVRRLEQPVATHVNRGARVRRQKKRR